MSKLISIIYAELNNWSVFNTVIDPPAIIKEHCDINFPYGNNWTGYNYPGTDTFEDGGYSGNYARTADAVVKLQMGGKAIPRRQNLWMIGASATQYTPTNAGAGAGAPEIMFLPQPIPAQDIIIGELGRQRSDGKLWVMLPDGEERTITPYVPGKDYYIFDITHSDKYTLTITANDHDLSQEKPEFCVGQLVTFVPHWSPGTPPYTEGDSIFHWHLPDKYVNEPYQYSDYCNSYRRNDAWLAYRTTHCWYVNGSGGACSIGMNLKFSNGQAVSIAAAGSFSIIRPHITRVAPNGPFGAVIDTNGTLPVLWLNGGAMDFKVYISKTFPGSFGISQLVNFYSETGMFPPPFFVPGGTYGGYWLDKSQEFYDGQIEVKLDSYPSNDEYPDGSQIYDTPGLNLLLYYGSYNGSWKDYVRFTPSGGIPITLGRVDWNWAATAWMDINCHWGISSDGVDGPALHDDDSFPVWSHMYPNGD